MTHTGSCLCGAVTYTGHGDIAEADACHCSMCRRSNAGGPYFAVHFKGGVTLDTLDAITWYRGSDWGERGFCATCGSNIAWRLQAMPDKIGVSLGTLNDTSDIKLHAHIFTDSAPDYYTVPDDAPHKTGEQVLAEFMARQDTNA
jgi:hypothetical protein